MKKISVCLVDDDDWFRDMFSQYMVHTCRNISMTSEDFESWKEENTVETGIKGENFDLYVFGDLTGTHVTEECVSAVSERSMFLYRSEAEQQYIRKAFPDANIIYKYSSASELAESINFALSKRQISGGLITNKSSLFVISVTSCSGGAGKTSFSVILSRLLQQKKKRNVLLVSTSLLYDVRKYFKAEGERQYRTLNEYLYHLFAGDGPESGLSLYIMKDRFGASSFYQPEGVSELAGLSGAEMKRFIDSLRDSDLFDTLIFDLNNTNDEVTGVIADCSDVMFVLTAFGDDSVKNAGLWSARILDYCRQEPGSMWMVVNKDGMYKNELKFFDEPEWKESYENQFPLKTFCIPYDPNSFFYGDGVKQISMTGSFAAAIDNTIREVISFV